jgi:hypothetical protein
MINSIVSIVIYLVFYLAVVLIIFALAKMRGLHLYKDLYPVCNLPGGPISDPDRVMEKIRQLYLAKIITNLYLDDDYISFEDHCLNHVHNIYYYRFSKPGNLYYRGLFTKYHFNRSKLRSIAAFLSEA